uniref:Uncharacterized protein n=1 Tax=Aegilops tauschii TaxID=37682 RepID=M8BQX3_AEGTA
MTTEKLKLGAPLHAVRARCKLHLARVTAGQARNASHWWRTPLRLPGLWPLQLAAWRMTHFRPPPPRRRTPVTGGAGAVDAKKLLVGVGCMGDLPGLAAIGSGYGGGFGNNVAGVLAGVTGSLRGVGGSVGSVSRFLGVGGAGGIPFKWFAVGGTPFGRRGGGRASSTRLSFRPPDMWVPGAWRLSVGGVPVPPGEA